MSEIEPIGCSRGGNASDHVVPKEQLAAFLDPRWIGVECSEKEIANALREPPVLVELEGLSDIPWGTLTHAYGTASDVPIDLRESHLQILSCGRRPFRSWTARFTIRERFIRQPLTRFPSSFDLPQTPSCRTEETSASSLRQLRKAAASIGIRSAKFGRGKRSTLAKDLGSRAKKWRKKKLLHTMHRAALIGQMHALQSLANDSDEGVAESGRTIVRHLGALPK